MRARAPLRITLSSRAASSRPSLRATFRASLPHPATPRRRLNSNLAYEHGNQARDSSILHGQQAEASHQAVKTPMERYSTLVESGTLRSDDHQTRIVQKLQRLHDDLIKYQPPEVAPSEEHTSSFFSRLFSPAPVTESTVDPAQVPKGLYLYGDVGTGKTMLMDLFYHSLPAHIARKRRVHFHAFMIDVHKRVHAMKAKLGHAGGDPIPLVAHDLAREAYILCFDEFQVTDIADAMILRQLFEKLLSYGIVCVITSNRHPDELYKNGIQRPSFIPCIELLKERFEVTNLDSGTDYRRIPRTLQHVYYDPLTPENVREVEKIFDAFTSDPADRPVRNRKLEIWGRTLLVPESSSRVAKFTFDDLCGKPLSAADYIEITKNFGTIFVLDVPKLGLDQKDKARRFITFVDACYEMKSKLFITSEVPIFKVFAPDEKEKGVEISDHMRSVMDDLGLSADSAVSTAMFTGDEELFAFARCCSRLVEMGSKQWAETVADPAQ